MKLLLNPLNVRLSAAFAFALILGAAKVAATQEASVPTTPLTLEAALRIAEARSEAIAGARAGVARAEGEQVRARSALFPQLSASVSYDRALASEFEGLFDGVDAPEGFPSDLPFGREHTWRLNLLFSQNLFSGGRIGAQRSVADATKAAADINFTITRAQLLFDVTQAYYDAALSERLVAIAEATLEQAEATVRQVSAAFRAGMQPEFELLRAQVTRDNLVPTLIRQRANRELAWIRLKQLLDLPADADLELAVSLEDASPPLPFAARVAEIEARARERDRAAALVGADVPLPDRAPVADAETAVRLREAALAAVKAERMPSISLNSSYGRVGYPDSGVPELDRLNWSVGVSMTVPVLTGGRLRGDEMVARAELEQTRARLQAVKELAAVDTRSAWAELLAALAAWDATGGTVEQAQRAHEIALVRYRAGVSTQLELSDARLLLQQAEANRARAARDLQVARARVALLPELPLGTVGTPSQAPAVPTPSAPAAPAQPSEGTRLRSVNTAGQGAAPAPGMGGPL
ncbi:MAG TPA: TolC family protein [Vicinamibacterales bacterium]|nr:TolC family protein [Vicinamibacterales bacterium]